MSCSPICIRAMRMQRLKYWQTPGFDVTTATVDVFRHGSPCMHLLRLPPHLVTLLVLFMRRACRRVRHRSKSFSPSICTEQPLSLRCSDRSSPREVPPSSSASQSGHRLGSLTAGQDAALSTTPTDQLLALPFLQPGQVTDSLHAYQIGKAWTLTPSHGRSGSLGQARCPGEHDQSWHRHDSTCEGRADRSSQRGIPADDQLISGRTCWDAGRSGHRGRTSHGTGGTSSREVTSSWAVASRRPTSSAS